MNSMSAERHSSNSPNKGASAKVQTVQKAWQTLYCMWGLTLHDTTLQQISLPETCVIYFPFMCHNTLVAGFGFSHFIVLFGVLQFIVLFTRTPGKQSDNF